MSLAGVRRVGTAVALSAGLGAAMYAAYAGRAWLRYGHPAPAGPDDADLFLDRFMPEYDVAERHHIVVAAPADVTFAALMSMDLEDSVVIRAIFKGREVWLGAEADSKPHPRGLVAMTKELGWRVLADVPGHELVMGAVTQPWKANVVFRGLTPDEFVAFSEPDYVKIVWTLRADAVNDHTSVARTETRVVATDAAARKRFRWYWARFSAGIVLIRALSLRIVKKQAERGVPAPGASWLGRHQGGSGSSTEIVVPPSGGTSISIVPP